MSLSPKGDTHCPSPKGESPKGDTHKLHKQKGEQKGTPNLGRFHMKSAARGASDLVVGPLCDDRTNKAFALIWEVR